MDVNETYCANHFTIYTNIESLCYIPDTNIMLDVNLYLNKKADFHCLPFFSGHYDYSFYFLIFTKNNFVI